MTNAQKYLKNGVDLCELIRNIADYKPKLETSDNVYAKMQEFFNAPVKLTLTEDERVILRNIQKGLFREGIIARTTGNELNVFIKETGEIIELYIFNHLFQFIKERRRI